ncbi:hypothetical protein LNY03_28870, partial [Pseudomonas nitroreducens]|nr:hypothetical protein [Pseudomonas nitroreducens]
MGWRIDYQVVTPSLRDRLKHCSIYRDERFSAHPPSKVDYAACGRRRGRAQVVNLAGVLTAGCLDDVPARVFL